MNDSRSTGGRTRAASRRLAALAGLGVLCLGLGTPTLAVPPTVAPPMGSGMGAGRMGAQSMDQHFIVMMIPHHDGAIAMADLALSRAKRPEIKALARRIKDSQTQENAQMRSWYRQWFGGPVPAWGGGMGHGGGMGMMGMGGTGTDVTWLKNASDIDRAFIQQMIPHHRMGVMMATMAQTNSQHPQLKALQQAMVKVQSQEIEQMAQWYRSWYGTP
ncbi:DUF305 domain-containing protein [Cyanobium sp. AMD-g]|uniref:DUF305 domain-containing protein n=1 Tax=Cyanobium sp. AMD-g TaxID=2823699 RepID=UPI0020CC68A4|nr:DUF305 domain-containing protein [Cyanobium sp. AMD-g]MCP9931809.1 DUF305 domain-containing protein [Cyanobium sp. AMD-g]